MARNNKFPEPVLSLQPVYDLFDGDEIGVYDIAEACGFGRNAFLRWEKVGVTLLRAEQIAEHLGLHPTAIWGAEYNFAVAAQDIRKRAMDAASKRNKRNQGLAK